MQSELLYTIGIDYGTDSVRSVLVDTEGNQHAEAVFQYPRWKKGLYTNSTQNQFRHHPLDYLEGLESTLTEITDGLSDAERSRIKGIAIDTTGSTPVAVDEQGTPLALHDRFAENPNAMFVLWKDHTAVQEAEEITEVAKSWGGTDFTKYIGGIYSSEWFWAKMLHIHREDTEVRDAAYSWVELCDWIPYALTGGNDIHEMKRSRCAAGHKAMWHEEFDGLPSEEFLEAVDPLLSGMREQLFEDTYTSNEPAGTLSSTWAEKLNLSEDVVVAVGAFDAHMGAVGGEIEPYHLSRVMGTSTCDIMIAPHEEVEGNLVKGICGQVDGSVVPGMMGLEAGQSGFGDIYAWFSKLIMKPYNGIIDESDAINAEQKKKLKEEASQQMIRKLSDEAATIDASENDIVALDWLNGRRTPDANQLLQGAMEGLNLGTDAARIFKALVESTCFGAKAIVDRFREEGIRIDGVIGLGGVAKKSSFVMQTLANVLNMPIKIASSDQACAHGAAMFAATAAGIFANVTEAKEAMGKGFSNVYHPNAAVVDTYQVLYERYLSLGEMIEKRTEDHHNE